MPRATLPHANGFYISDSLPVSAQECTNWYVSIPQAPALSEKILLGTPGYLQIATTGELNQVNRGAHVKSGIPYFVNGEALYRLDRATDEEGIETFFMVMLGAIPGSGRVSMADNGTQLMVLVPGGNGYIYNEDAGTPFQEITDGDFRANGDPQYTVFLDGYFVITTNSKKFIISAINDGLSYNALDFGTAEADPDDIVAPVVHRNQLFITGSQTTEVFQNIGGADFPFQRVQGFVIDKGLFAPFSAINANKTWMMIGGGENESPAIWAFNGSDFDKISTNAIDSILQRFSREEIEASFSYAYAQKGAYFVAFALPTTTLVIDTITGAWHERKSQVVNLKGVTETLRQRSNSLVTAYNRVLVGDSVDGRIGQVDPDVYTEYGKNIIRTAVTQPFADQGNSVNVPELEPVFEAGVGNSEVADPKIRVSFSKDGKRWSDERSKPIGKIGEYMRRSIFYRLGRFPRFALLKVVLSDAVKPVYIKLEAKIKIGRR